MTKEHAEETILNENRHTNSREDQVAISHGFWDEGILSHRDGLRMDAIEDRLDLDLDYNVGTSVGHLEEISMIEATTPSGPDYYVISERLDEIINGRVDEGATEDMEGVIKHMQDDDPLDDEGTRAVADGAGVTIRSVLASEFDVVPDALEDYLREGDQVEKLNDAVQAIRNHDGLEERDSYGEIIFRRGAYRYRQTSRAVDLYEREEDGE